MREMTQEKWEDIYMRHDTTCVQPSITNICSYRVDLNLGCNACRVIVDRSANPDKGYHDRFTYL